jgi:hypothetical protein
VALESPDLERVERYGMPLRRRVTLRGTADRWLTEFLLLLLPLG